MIQKTLWKPDTCKCEIEYQWDDSVAQEDRVHTLHSIFRCPLHQGVSPAVAYQTVLDENQSKNKAIGLVVKHIDKMKGKEADISWRFDGNRDVILTHPDLDVNDKNVLKNVDKTGIVKKVSFE